MRKINHPIDPAEMMAYLDGELSVDRATVAATHLERCPECQRLAGELRTVSNGISTWQVESTEMQPGAALIAALAQRVQRRPWRERFAFRPWAWVLVSAGVVVLVVAVPRGRQQKMTVARSAAMDKLEVLPEQAPPPPRALLSYAKPQEKVSELNGPLVARTSALILTTHEFDRARTAIDDILKRQNGYLASLNISAPAEAPRSLTATLRVPAGKLAATMVELKQLGRVESEQQNGEEVTAQYTDLEARLANARNTEQRLTDILRQRTGKLSDVLDVERELDRVRGEIEQMDGEKKTLTKRVDFATVNLTVTESYKARLEMVPDSTFGRIRNAAVEGYRDMIAGLVSVALLIAAVAPTLLLWTALLFYPVRFAWRRWRRAI